MPGAPLNLDLPVAGDAWATWKSKIEAAFADIEADLEAPVLFSEISAASTLNCNNQAISNLKYLQFYLGNSTAIPARGVGFKDGEFYITDAAGNSIQVTNGGVLNYAATGGFVGEYVSAGAQASFVNATDLYEFKNEAGAAYADIRLDDLYVSNSTTAYCQIGFGGSSNISLLLPTALPAGAALMTVDNTGQISASATVAVASTFSADITLSGTAELNHPDWETTIPAGDLVVSANVTLDYDDVGLGEYSYTGNATIRCAIPHELAVKGDRLKSVAVKCDKGDTGTLTVNVYKRNFRQASVPATYATANSSSSGTDQTVTATAGAPSALATGESFVFNIVITGSAALNTIYSVQFTFDHP